MATLICALAVYVSASLSCVLSSQLVGLEHVTASREVHAARCHYYFHMYLLVVY